MIFDCCQAMSKQIKNPEDDRLISLPDFFVFNSPAIYCFGASSGF